MKEIISKIKKELSKSKDDQSNVIDSLKELRTYFIDHLKEPGLVKMIRFAYEDIENNGSYSFLFLEEEDSRANLEYLLDLLADFGNKYNQEELREIRDLMEGIERTEEEVEA
jgi:hypothetical protein